MDKMTLLLGILMGSIAYKLFKSLYRQLFESYIFESKTSNIKNILAKTTIKMLGKVQGYIDKATSYLQHSVLNGEEKNGVVEVYDEISGDTITISKEAAKKKGADDGTALCCGSAREQRVLRSGGSDGQTCF